MNENTNYCLKNEEKFGNRALRRSGVGGGEERNSSKYEHIRNNS